jgi:hypothetical protein
MLATIVKLIAKTLKLMGEKKNKFIATLFAFQKKVLFILTINEQTKNDTRKTD